MTNMGSASSSGDVVSDLLARSRRPAVVPRRMPLAYALPSVEEALPAIEERLHEAVPASPSAVPPGRNDRGSVDALPSLPAPATVEMDAVTAPIFVQAHTDLPEDDASATRSFPAMRPRFVDPAVYQTDGAEEPRHVNPLPLLATLTERATRESVEVPVELVVFESTVPSAVNTLTEIAARPTDREPTDVVAAVRPVPVVDNTPPVAIGEINVHVAAPAEAKLDPLALLAPWANGLTARRTASA